MRVGMIWRAAIVAAYVALAIVIAVVYGGHGLATLLFFYFCAGFWVAFVEVWGWVMRESGRRYASGLDGSGSRH
jgi:hypothetical protein